MSDLLVARVNGVIKAPDGTQYRLVRGKTLADAGHPAAAAYPQSFMPVEVHLSATAGAHAAVEESAKATELADALTEAEAYAAELTEQFTRIVDALDARKLLDGVDRERPGWLADRLGELLAPKAPARKSTPAKTARADGA